MSREKIFFLLILSCFTIFAFSYSLITPSFEGPDEESHLSYLVADSRLPSHPFSIYHSSSFYYFIMGNIFYFVDQPDSPTSVNYGYPFDYKGRYNHGPADIFPFSNVPLEVHLLRIFSIIFGNITLIFTYKISKIIFKQNKQYSLFTMAFVSLIPTFIWINSVINTDVFVWMFSTIAIYFLLKFLQQFNQYKFLILTSIFTGIAIFSKGNGYFLYPIILSSLIYLVLSKKISILKFFQSTVIFLSVTIISGAYKIPVGNFLALVNNTGFYSGSSLLRTPNISSNLNYVDEHLLNFDFIHTRLIEFSLSGMGQNVIWIPKIYFFIGDVLVAIILIGLFYTIIKKRFNHFGIEKNFLVVFLAPVFVLFIIFYNWITSEVGVARYTFPIIAIFGVLSTIGLFSFVKDRKNLQLLLLLPLLFLGYVNVLNIMEIQNELGAFGVMDSDGDGIYNDLDIEPFSYSNFFTDGTTSGEIKRITPGNVTDSNPLKKETLRQIQGWSPDFEHLLDLVPPNLYNNPDNRKAELRHILDDLVQEKKIISHGDAWTIATQKILMQKDENGIRLRNDNSDTFLPIEIDTCNKNLILNYTDEIVFSCNGELIVLPHILKPLPTDIQNGDLIQGENQSKVYLIQNGKKHHIRTIETFEKLGFTTDMIKFIPKRILDEIPTGAPI